ncbi:MAG: TolC family protein [Salinivirgaceae bacterium]|nr:TolC family protein [Salinivirgaceae bacterium]
MKKTSILAVAAVLVANVATAQDEWTLERCISYAIDNNITIKQQQLSVEQQKNSHEQSRLSVLPSVNAGLSQSYSFGQSTGEDNTFVNNNSSTTSGHISASVTLFNGLSKYNQIKVSKLNYEAALQNLEQAKNNMSLNITSAYLDVLLNKELLATAQEQLQLTQEQIETNRQQIEAGKLAAGKLLETESQAAQEELDVTNRENSLLISKITLQQLLELPVNENFDIVVPNIDFDQVAATLLSVDTVYERAVEERPEIKSRELAVESADRQIAVARAQQYPSLSASAGYSNSYYKMSGMPNQSVSDQLDLHASKSIGLSLNIPIFNGWQTRTSVKNSKLNYQNSQLELQQAKNTLLKEIQQVYVNAQAALKRYESSQKAVSSADESFRYVKEKFDLGIVTPLEFNEAKNRLAQAQSTFIQAKYEYLFRMKILDFYYGRELKI